MSVKTPWLKHYGHIPANLEYPQDAMVDQVERTAKRYPDILAYEFMGKGATYRQLVAQIHRCAKALRAIGIRPGDKVTICMPNTPQAVMMFYAINRIGALANMIHPLSGEEEIVFYLNKSQSVAVLTLQQFYPKFAAIRDRINVRTLILTGIGDALPTVKRIGYGIFLKRIVFNFVGSFKITDFFVKLVTLTHLTFF